MNEQKVKVEIEKILSDNYKVWRQYPASKAQVEKLKALGIYELMPKRAKGNVVGHTDAAKVLAAAEDAGGYHSGVTAWGEGEMTYSPPSALYKALHEDDEVEVEDDEVEDEDDEVEDDEDEVEDDEDEDDEVEVAEYDLDDQVYIVYRLGHNYCIDAEWSDGPINLDHEPSFDEVRKVHDMWHEAVRLEEELVAAEAEYAAEQQQRSSEAEQQALIEEFARDSELDELHPLSHFAGLVSPATLRRAAGENRLRAEKWGRDWFASERDVRDFLRRARLRRSKPKDA